MRKMRAGVLLLTVGGLLDNAVPAFPQGLALALEEVAVDIDKPVGFVGPRDGSGRMFIVERAGRIWTLSGGTVLTEPFLDLSAKILISSVVHSEQGILGLAFAPDFGDTGLFYVSYTDLNGAFVLARFELDESDPNLGDPGSEEVLLTIPQSTGIHYSGDLEFGPDGFLYITRGDGEWGDPGNLALDLESLLGKILRLDVSGEPDPGLPYAIPEDNPFVGDADSRGEIWAYGLRNPWRMAFDRATGDLFVGDVGHQEREEVNFQPADNPGGENYGWKVLEGTRCNFDEPEGICDEFMSGLSTLPILEYINPGGSCAAVISGYRYRGPDFPQLDGVYLYADYCMGLVWGTVPRCDGGWESQTLLDTGFRITSFGEDETGEVYVTEYDHHEPGKIHRLVLAAGAGGPSLIGEPAELDFGSVPVGQRATLDLVLSNANAGPEALHVHLLELASGGPLSLDLEAGVFPCGSDPFCLGPGEICTLEVAFEPTVDGPVETALLGEGNTLPLALPISGTGTESCVEILELESQVLDQQATYFACSEIRTGPDLQVVAPGKVTLRAGERVVLRSGTRVASGARLEVVIDPTLVTP